MWAEATNAAGAHIDASRAEIAEGKFRDVEQRLEAEADEALAEITDVLREML